MKKCVKKWYNGAKFDNVMCISAYEVSKIYLPKILFYNFQLGSLWIDSMMDGMAFLMINVVEDGKGHGEI